LSRTRPQVPCFDPTVQPYGIGSTLELHIAKLNVPALRFEPEVPFGHLTLIPRGRHAAVDPEDHLLAFAGDLVGVPFAGLFAALRFLIIELDALLLATDERIAEEITDVPVPN